MTIRPLTRRNGDGQLYRRDDGVEQQIVTALTLSPAALLERAAIRDYRVRDFLQEECLVYLIRENFHQGQNDLADQLAQILLRRCIGFLTRKLQALGPQEFEDAYAEVINELFLRIAEVGNDRSDFLQVRFWVGLDGLATRAFTRYLKVVKRAAATVALSSLAGEETERDGDDEAINVLPLENRPDSSLPVVEEIVLRDELNRAQEGLALIEEPYRTAFILRHFYDWPIQDADPSVPTISQFFGKTPRTITNWLYKAEQALEAWRGARA